MINLVAESLLIAGVLALIVALIPVRQLISQLPYGQVRRSWFTLTLLIVIFIVGYMMYAVSFWSRQTTLTDLIVPGIFFLGSGFVWLASTLSLQTAIDIRRVTLLERENITDPLMGIYNRRYLDRRLEEEITRAQRYTLPLSVLLIDIDRFKRINDTYGHPVGDLVLSYLGNLLLQAIRESDIAARYGGEEILIIAPNTTISTAGALAERLRHHVEAHALVLTNQSNNPQEIRITISVGVASLSETSDSQRIVYNADEALYQAKQEGRNRIVIHDIHFPNLSSPAGE
jgi:diguanylate cyclase (GGDEF)-like protein